MPRFHYLLSLITKMLIPKNHETTELKNWRGLTMLTLTEKILAKLMANRVKLVAGRLVDPQQTGFLKGRDIMDNILTFKLVEEVANSRRRQLIFLNLDFMKDYDRISHDFI